MWQNLKNLAGKSNKHVIVQESGHSILTLAMFLYSCLHYLQWGWCLISATTKKMLAGIKEWKKTRVGHDGTYLCLQKAKPPPFKMLLSLKTQRAHNVLRFQSPSHELLLSTCVSRDKKKEKIKVGPLTVGVFAFQTCAKLPRCFFFF